MSFQISPGVQVKEEDLSLIIPSIPISIGAIVGDFQWGPVNEIRLVDSTEKLEDFFGRPDGSDPESAKDWFCAYNYLQYSKDLRVVRVRPAIEGPSTDGGTDSRTTIANAADSGNTGLEGGTSFFEAITEFDSNGDVFDGSSGQFAYEKIVVDNEEDFINYKPLLEDIYTTVNTTDKQPLRFIARYPGDTGNQLKVSFASAENYEGWDYEDQFDYAPSDDNQEFFLVVLMNGEVVEQFEVSLNKNATDRNGQSKYAGLINEQSDYIYILEENFARMDGGAVKFVMYHDGASTPTYTYFGDSSGDVFELDLIEGENTAYEAGVSTDRSALTMASAKIFGWDMFASAEDIDINFCMIGGTEVVDVIKHVVQNVCETRMDCVAFISPPQSMAVNNSTPATDIADWYRTTLNINSSYAVADGNYKLQLDPYNRVYRWVPLNGDIAGLAARTSYNRDPWRSPAGMERGQIKNVNRLAFIPSKAMRDQLYKNSVNIVTAFPGEGFILYGDKTLTSRPSAFDRINVRMLFIVLEKAIAKAARNLLFEFNDEFTRTRFVQMVEPYLRDVQSRRGIQRHKGRDGFYVLADTRINTPEVIDRNEFRARIFIKPNRSINFITLTFSATRTGVVFEELIEELFPEDA